MRKVDEVAHPDSCLNRANDDEMLFVLLGRDKTFPEVVRFWVERRVYHGLNDIRDPQIKDALATARRVEVEQATQECQAKTK